MMESHPTNSYLNFEVILGWNHEELLERSIERERKTNHSHDEYSGNKAIWKMSS